MSQKHEIITDGQDPVARPFELPDPTDRIFQDRVQVCAGHIALRGDFEKPGTLETSAVLEEV